MEQSPFYSSESPGDSSGDTKDTKKSTGVYGDRSAPEGTPRPPVDRVERITPVLDRVIRLWDRTAEEEHRSSPEAAETADGNEKDKEGKGNKNKDTAKSYPQPQQPTEQAVAPASTLEEAQQLAAESDENADYEGDLSEPVVSEAMAGPNPDYEDLPEAVYASTPRPTPRAVTPSTPESYVYTPRAERLYNEYDPAPQDEGVYSRNVYEEGGHDDAAPSSSQPSMAGGGNQPPVPPRRPTLQPEGPPPSPPYRFAEQYMHPGVAMGTSYNTAPDSPNLMPNAAPVMPIEHPLRTAPNRDPGARQAAALLGLGLFAEHLGRKREDRRLRKANERTNKRIEQQSEAATISQRQMQENQRQFAYEQERQAQEMRQIRQSQERFAVPPVPFPEQYHSVPPARQFEAAPNTGPVSALRTGEARPPQNSERPLEPTGEQVVATDADPLVLSPHQQFEHSSWHNIVVDDRGHEVTGAIRYGEGFQRERQQEILRDRMGDGSPASIGSAQHQDQFGPMYPGALPSGMTNPTLPPGRPTHIDPQHQLQSTNKKTDSNFTNPWFWMMILLIIAAFFTAALI